MSPNADIRVAVSGAAGSMGRTVCRAVHAAEGMVLVGAVDPNLADGAAVPTEVFESLAPEGGVHGSLETCLGSSPVDVVVDFTWAQAVRENLLVCLDRGIAAVTGTTGMTEADLELLATRAQETGTPVLFAPNFALGAVLMMEFSKQAARHFDWCEVIEQHHERKRDAPSGTAKRTAELIEGVWGDRGAEGRVATHSVRMPGVVADQEVVFGALGQTLRIEHRTTSRESFMPGVLLAIRRVRDLQGLTVGLENIL